MKPIYRLISHIAAATSLLAFFWLIWPDPDSHILYKIFYWLSAAPSIFVGGIFVACAFMDWVDSKTLPAQYFQEF